MDPAGPLARPPSRWGKQEGLMLVSWGSHCERRKNSVLRQPEVTPIFFVGKETLLRVKVGVINDPVGTQM